MPFINYKEEDSVKRIVPIFFIINLLSFVSCERATNSRDVNDSTYLSVAVLPVYDCIPFYYAEQEGLFDSIGVNVKLVTYNSAMDADTAFAKGKVHGAVTDIVKASLWMSKGDSMKIVMAIDPEISLVTSMSARLFKPDDIKEKIIAITRHSMLDFTTDEILRSVKMSSEDLNKPQINDIILRTQMNNQNQYDGALLPEPYTQETTKMCGAKLLTSTYKLGLHYLAALVFNDSIINNRHEDVAKLIKAYTIATERLNRNKEYPLRYLPNNVYTDIPDTIFEYKQIAEPKLPSDTLLQKVNTWLIGRKLIKESVNYKSLVDTTFINRQK